MREVAITTEDNPFDPIDDFDNWFKYDTDKGYWTLSYLDRVAYPSSELSDADNDAEYERAIDEICYFNGNYKKIVKES